MWHWRGVWGAFLCSVCGPGPTAPPSFRGRRETRRYHGSGHPLRVIELETPGQVRLPRTLQISRLTRYNRSNLYAAAVMISPRSWPGRGPDRPLRRQSRHENS